MEHCFDAMDDEDFNSYAGVIDSSVIVDTHVKPAFYVSDDEPDVEMAYIVYGEGVKIMPTRCRIENKSIFTNQIVIGCYIAVGKDKKPYRECFVAKVLTRSKTKPDCVIIRMQNELDPIYTFNGDNVEIPGIRLFSHFNYILYLSPTIQINGIPNIGDGRSLGILGVHEHNLSIGKGDVVRIHKTNSSWSCNCIVLGFVHDTSVWRVVLFVDAVNDRSSTSLNIDRLALIQFTILAKIIKQENIPIISFEDHAPGSDLHEAVDNTCRKAEPYLGKHCAKKKVITRILNDAITVRLKAVQKDPTIKNSFIDTSASEAEQSMESTNTSTIFEMKDPDSLLSEVVPSFQYVYCRFHFVS